MNLRSPIVAILWENWRLSRVEAGQRLGIGLVAGAGALLLSDNGATFAFWILVTVNSMIWFSIAKLNGGRFADGYKPGYPLYLHHTRPLPTILFVGVSAAYDAISCTALYLVSAAVLGLAFGKSLPLLSMIPFLVVYHLAYVCCQWSTRNRVVQWVGSGVFAAPMLIMLFNSLTPSLQVEISLYEHAAIVLIGVVAFGLTVAGVVRQRRGDAVERATRVAGSGGYPDWMIGFFQFACPTSSAARAQIWFELKSSGIPVLTLGIAAATMIALLFAISIPIAPFRHAAVAVASLSVPLLLLGLGSNAFGIRRKQGRTYASAYELTQPCGTAQMAGLKLLVRAVCVLVALAAIGVSLWASSSLLGAWGPWLPDGKNDTVPKLLQLRRAIGDTFGGLTPYASVALAVVAAIIVAATVAGQAAREALRTRYPRLVLAVQWAPAVWGLAIILLTLAIRKELGPVPLLGEVVRVSFWIFGIALVLGTIYALWSGFAQRVLTIRYVCGALVVATIFWAAWRTGIPAGDGLGVLWLALGILMVIVLAPWALGRVRHA